MSKKGLNNENMRKVIKITKKTKETKTNKSQQEPTKSNKNQQKSWNYTEKSKEIILIVKISWKGLKWKLYSSVFLRS